MGKRLDEHELGQVLEESRITQLAERIFDIKIRLGLYATLTLQDDQPVLIVHDGRGNDDALAYWNGREWAVEFCDLGTET